jgi:nicotinamidase-related amidase
MLGAEVPMGTRHELLEARRSVLVVIDLQGKLMEMIERPRMVITNTIRLMKLAEMHGVPVVLTEQYPRGLGPTHAEIRAAYDALPGWKRHVDKTSFGCWGDPAFAAALDEARPGLPPGERQVVVCGIEAHVCVMQTVLELVRTGHAVHLAWDAISGRGAEYRRHALERMQLAGAIVTNHESVGFEWTRDKEHACFKAMSALFREGQVA